MNEKIKDLIDQQEFGFALVGDTGIEGAVIYRRDLEKFAELIVKECCDMVNKHTQHNNSHDCLLVLDIKEHFGIKR